MTVIASVAFRKFKALRETSLTLLPNHAMNSEGELEGFVFECCADDPASVLPLTKSSFATTAIYECLPDAGCFQHLSSHAAEAADKLREAIASLERLGGVEPLKFDCMPDWESVSEQKDQR